jgi:hypothetical protein
MTILTIHPRRQVPVREFKGVVGQVARSLAKSHPDGFGYTDIAQRLGRDFGVPGPSERRLRRSLAGLCAAGVLARKGRGCFIAGPQMGGDDAIGMATQIAQQLQEAFANAGGIMPISEVLSELGRQDDAKARLVRKVLSQSPLYFSGLPLDGCRTHWLLIDSERKKVPLPGRWLMLDLQLTLARMGNAKASWQWGLEGGLAALRARIGRGLKDARELMGLRPDDMVGDPATAAALEWCLQNAQDVSGPVDDFGGGARASVAQWWQQGVQLHGRVQALSEAWQLLESDLWQEQCLVHVLDVRFWRAVGKLTGLDPAILSRGALVHDDTNDLRR